MPIVESGIYAILCLTTGKSYIGSSKNIRVRWNHHRRYLNLGKHSSPYLQNSWIKYGKDAFEFIKIEECEPDREILIVREQYYLDKLLPEFNVYKKAYSPVGHKLTLEQRTKISLAHKGRILSPEHKAKLSAVRKAMFADGKIDRSLITGQKEWTNEQRLNISMSVKKLWKDTEYRARHKLGDSKRPPVSQETKAKLSVALRGRKNTWAGKKENRAKISAGLRGRFLSKDHKEKIRIAVNKPEVKAKIVAASTGRSPSQETRSKMSVAMKAMYAEKRLKRICTGNA